MRRWFFVLMILMLPLRAWVGDAMAMQMALPGQHAPAAGAMQHPDVAPALADAPHAQVNPVALTAAADCAGHSDPQQSSGDELEAAHCEACAMCQTCHTVAVLLPGMLVAHQLSPSSPPAIMQTFASADRALLLEPPIY